MQCKQEDARHRSMVRDGWRPNRELVDSTVRTRDDDVQDSSVCVRGLIHVLHQSEGIEDQLELQGGKIRGVLQMDVEITGDDQMRVECCHGFQQISKFIEKR